MVIKSAINERSSLAFTIRWSWPETLYHQETHRLAVQALRDGAVHKAMLPTAAPSRSRILAVGISLCGASAVAFPKECSSQQGQPRVGFLAFWGLCLI